MNWSKIPGAEKMEKWLMNAEKDFNMQLFNAFEFYGYNREWLLNNLDKVMVYECMDYDNRYITRLYSVNNEELFKIKTIHWWSRSSSHKDSNYQYHIENVLVYIKEREQDVRE